MLFPPQVETSNRVLQKFHDKLDRFLCVPVTPRPLCAPSSHPSLAVLTQSIRRSPLRAGASSSRSRTTCCSSTRTPPASTTPSPTGAWSAGSGGLCATASTLAVRPRPPIPTLRSCLSLTPPTICSRPQVQVPRQLGVAGQVRSRPDPLTPSLRASLTSNTSVAQGEVLLDVRRGARPHLRRHPRVDERLLVEAGVSRPFLSRRARSLTPSTLPAASARPDHREAVRAVIALPVDLAPRDRLHAPARHPGHREGRALLHGRAVRRASIRAPRGRPPADLHSPPSSLPRPLAVGFAHDVDLKTAAAALGAKGCDAFPPAIQVRARPRPRGRSSSRLADRPMGQTGPRRRRQGPHRQELAPPAVRPAARAGRAPRPTEPDQIRVAARPVAFVPISDPCPRAADASLVADPMPSLPPCPATQSR